MKTIMLVDDDRLITQTLAVLIKISMGHQVVIYNSPKEALACKELALGKIDLIISDFIMPEINGIEFLLQAKKIAPETESILLTGYADKENAIKSINKVGVYYYLEKPWNNEELVKIINNALDKKSLSDELKNKLTELKASSNENRRLYELVSKEYTEEKENIKSLIILLANLIEAKDVYTDGHTRRVSFLAKKLGEAFSLSQNDIDTLEIVGIIHDIGKIGVAEEILNKPGKLTDEEFEVMKKHPELGEKICKPISAFDKCLPVIRHHHEKLNGEGYPDGLKGDEISKLTRIVTVVDIFDALYSDRPYRQKLPFEKVKAIMYEDVEKGRLDKEITDKLFEMVSKDHWLEETFERI
jgi:response regulator RpfG family c-di-GMP phosphodiesterase